MTQYLLTIYQPDGSTPPPDVLERVMRDVGALVDEATQAGVLVFTGGLATPEVAKVARAQGDEVFVTDGPYVETKEHVGGLFIIAVPDIEVAVDWARKVARVITLPIEVRAFR